MNAEFAYSELTTRRESGVATARLATAVFKNTNHVVRTHMRLTVNGAVTGFTKKDTHI
jgi:hypothetical protein